MLTCWHRVFTVTQPVRTTTAGGDHFPLAQARHSQSSLHVMALHRSNPRQSTAGNSTPPKIPWLYPSSHQRWDPRARGQLWWWMKDVCTVCCDVANMAQNVMSWSIIWAARHNRTSSSSSRLGGDYALRVLVVVVVLVYAREQRRLGGTGVFCGVDVKGGGSSW